MSVSTSRLAGAPGVSSRFRPVNVRIALDGDEGSFMTVPAGSRMVSSVRKAYGRGILSWLALWLIAARVRQTRFANGS